MLHSGLPFAIGLLLVLATPPAMAAKKQTDTSAPVADKNGCFKKVGGKGRPHKLSSVANLSAVRAWVQMALKYGDDYAMWHNAGGSSVKCKKLPRSDYYSCFASGKPCPPGSASSMFGSN